MTAGLSGQEPDDVWMQAAIAAGQRGGPDVRPNPRVGCAIVRDQQLVAVGWHERAGGPHAEVQALAAAGEAARGATAYVTLEPCAHFGRTPPCADALIAAGVRRVVVAVRDPHPIAAGGIARLRAAGVEVSEGVAAAAAEALAEVFLTNVRAARSHLRLKVAASLDGFTAAIDGTSQWITGPRARARVHALRADADAVMVGSGTVLADDPGLDPRHDAAARRPLRVVLDRRLRTPAAAAIADVSRGPARIYTSEAAIVGAVDRVASLRARAVEVVPLDPGPDAEASADTAFVRAVLQHLYLDGRCAVLCEGGATLAGALWRAGVVDRLDLVLAPIVLGGGAPLWRGWQVPTLAEAMRWSLDPSERLGDDLWLSARPLAPGRSGGA